MEETNRKRGREDDAESIQYPKRQKLESKGVRLLSFDGSQILLAALSQLLILKEIMERIAYDEKLYVTPSPWEYFDLIGGTGVGGIFALLFAIWRLSIDEVIDVFQTLIEKVFVSDAWSRQDADAAGHLLDDVILEIAADLGKDALQVLEQNEKGSIECRAFACTLNPGNLSSPRLFRTYRARANRSPDCTIAEALKASIAGQPHLDPVLLGRPAERFISAIQRVSNPTSQILNEAQAVFGSEAPVACIVSLGTGQKQPLSANPAAASDNAELVKLVLDTEQRDQEMERRCGSAKDFFFRLDVMHGLEELAVDSKALSDITTHSKQYLALGAVGNKVDRLVKVLRERPVCVTTERLNTILGPDAQDETLKTVKDMNAKIDQRDTIDKGSILPHPISTVADYSTDNRLHEIIAWLSPNYTIHSSLRECRNVREEGTGLWLIATDEFREWTSAITRMLTLEGIPGGGKTIIASIVYDHLNAVHSEDSDVLVIGAFIMYGATKSIEDILLCLLCQILERGQGQWALKSAEDLFKKRNEGRPTCGTLQEALGSGISQVSRVLVVLDALDEFPTADRQKLLNTLLGLSPCVQLFVTTRPIPGSIRQHIAQNYVYMNASNDSDLKRFVRSKIQQDSRLTRLLSCNREMSDKVMNTVLERCQGMFLLAHFHMDELATYRTSMALDNALLSLPTTAPAKYTFTLDRIQQQPERDGSYALHAFMWMTLAHLKRYERWTMGQLVLAVASSTNELGEIGTTELLGRDLIDVCSGLLVIQDGYPSFVHLTALEYFRVYFAEENKDRFLKAHYAMTAGCIRYICAHHPFETLSEWISNSYEYMARWHVVRNKAKDMFDYCARNWAKHARHLRRNNAISFQVHSRLLHLSLPETTLSDTDFSNCQTYDEDMELVNAVRRQSFAGMPLACPGLPLAFQVKHDTILQASEKGDHGLVQLFLSCPNIEMILNICDDSGRSPLSYAASNGHQNVIELLLSRSDIALNSLDNEKRSPLFYATRGGHLSAVEHLLDQPNIRADSRDRWGRSPLFYAVENGHESVVKLLLSQKDVEADSRDKYGRSPLSWAADNGHERVVKLLLSRPDVEADSRAKWGQSPLSYAAENGHESVVKLLLSRLDVEADSRDRLGRSLLSCAAENGHESVVKLLLSRPDVEADSRDKYGRFPLSYAAENGHKNVVKLLLSRPDVEADSRNEWGRSPLSYAAEKGHESVVKLLLSRLDVESDSRDKYGRSPLSYAAENGHESVVKLLLSRLDVEADSRDRLGRSLLSCAAENGHESVVKLLLSRPDVEADSRDEWGQSPLLFAAVYGHKNVVKLLLSRLDVESDSRDIYGRSPLLFAAMYGHESVVKLLLSRPDVEADSRDDFGRSPLSYTAETGCKDAVELLLTRTDVIADSKDNDGQSPLDYAHDRGHIAIVEILRGHNLGNPEPDEALTD